MNLKMEGFMQQVERIQKRMADMVMNGFVEYENTKEWAREFMTLLCEPKNMWG